MKKVYLVRLKCHNIYGGIPSDPNVIVSWLNANGIQDDEELAEKIANGVASEEELHEKLRKITTTFLSDDQGNLYFESRCIKAALKQSANVMGLYGMIPGLSQIIKEGTEIRPELIIFIHEDGTFVKKEEMSIEVGLCHTIDARGNHIDAFNRSNVLRDVYLSFQIHTTDRSAILKKYGAKEMRKKANLTKEMIEDIFKYMGEFTGLGAHRSQGRGKCELIEVKEVEVI